MSSCPSSGPYKLFVHFLLVHTQQMISNISAWCHHFAQGENSALRVCQRETCWKHIEHRRVKPRHSSSSTRCVTMSACENVRNEVRTKPITLSERRNILLPRQHASKQLLLPARETSIMISTAKLLSEWQRLECVSHTHNSDSQTHAFSESVCVCV